MPPDREGPAVVRILADADVGGSIQIREMSASQKAVLLALEFPEGKRGRYWGDSPQ